MSVLYCPILFTWHRCIISRLVHKVFYRPPTFGIYRKLYKNFAITYADNETFCTVLLTSQVVMTQSLQPKGREFDTTWVCVCVFYLYSIRLISFYIDVPRPLYLLVAIFVVCWCPMETVACADPEGGGPNPPWNTRFYRELETPPPPRNENSWIFTSTVEQNYLACCMGIHLYEEEEKVQ